MTILNNYELLKKFDIVEMYPGTVNPKHIHVWIVDHKDYISFNIKSKRIRY